MAQIDRQYFVTKGREGGKKAAKNMTKPQRIARAKKAAAARKKK
jgi:hypothetical protein